MRISDWSSDVCSSDLMARGTGQIAIVASMAGYRGIPGSASYCASKGALITLAEAWRPEFARGGIRIQIVNPGFVRGDASRRSSFPTPFTMDADAAAEALYSGRSSRRFEIRSEERRVGKECDSTGRSLWVPSH